MTRASVIWGSGGCRHVTSRLTLPEFPCRVEPRVKQGSSPGQCPVNSVRNLGSSWFSDRQSKLPGNRNTVAWILVILCLCAAGSLPGVKYVSNGCADGAVSGTLPSKFHWGQTLAVSPDNIRMCRESRAKWGPWRAQLSCLNSSVISAAVKATARQGPGTACRGKEKWHS